MAALLHWPRQKCQPDEFARNLRLRPPWMLPPKALTGQYPSKHTHFKGQEQALFS